MTMKQRNESTVGVTPDAMNLVGCASHTEGPQADPAATGDTDEHSRSRRIRRHIHSSMKRLMSWVVLVVGIGVQGTPYLLVNRIGKTAKDIGISIKRNAKIGLVGLALASPLVINNKAEAQGVEGYVLTNYYITGLGGDACNVSFIEGASYGWDQFDIAYYDMPFPGDVRVKTVGFIEGKEAMSIIHPPLNPGDSASESFYGSLIVQRGTINLENTNHYLTWSISGLETCNITINGTNARTTNTINLGTLTGTYPTGEHSTATWEINVEYPQTTPGNPDPNEPNEPTNPNEVIYPEGELLIQNIRSRSSIITEVCIGRESNASDNIVDGEEVIYKRFTGIPPSAILARKGDIYLTPQKDSNNSNNPFYLEQFFFSEEGYAYNPWNQTNSLVFSFPDPNNKKFGEQLITFQEYIPDPNDPNYPKVIDPNAETYPVYLIRDMIEEDPNGLGVVLLPDIKKGNIYAGTWHNFILRTDTPTIPLAIADFNKDRIVDANDYQMLENAIGYEGNSQFDIARLKDPLALPTSNNYGKIVIGQGGDNIVDNLDKTAFVDLWIEDEKRRGIYDPNNWE